MNFVQTWVSLNAYPCAPLGSITFMYHLRARPLKVVWNSTSLFASRFPLDLQIASYRNQCCSTSLSPLPQNYGYRAIEPPAFPTIVDLTDPIKVNPNGPSCNILGDPNILPVFVLLVVTDELTELK
jgi:hypothetical protein